MLEVAELPAPQPGPGEVRIRVAAATVNPTDIGFRAGRQASPHLAAMGVHPRYVPGMELAGVVDAAGGGAQAELVVVPSASVTRVPAGTSLEAAATLPMNGLTVRLALDLLALRPGQTLGVTGAVGGYAVQLGANEGLRVIAIAGLGDEALVRGLGAAVFIPRGDGALRAEVRLPRRLPPRYVPGTSASRRTRSLEVLAADAPESASAWPAHRAAGRRQNSRAPT